MIDSLSLNTTGKTSAILSFPFPRHLHVLLQISPGCECARFPCSAPSEVRWQSSCTEAPHWFNSWVPEKLHIPWRKRIFSTHCLKLHNPALSPGTATADLSRALVALPWLQCVARPQHAAERHFSPLPLDPTSQEGFWVSLVLYGSIVVSLNERPICGGTQCFSRYSPSLWQGTAQARREQMLSPCNASVFFPLPWICPLDF